MAPCDAVGRSRPLRCTAVVLDLDPHSEFRCVRMADSVADRFTRHAPGVVGERGVDRRQWPGEPASWCARPAPARWAIVYPSSWGRCRSPGASGAALSANRGRPVRISVDRTPAGRRRWLAEALLDIGHPERGAMVPCGAKADREQPLDDVVMQIPARCGRWSVRISSSPPSCAATWPVATPMPP